MSEVFRAKLNREGRLFVPAGCRSRAGLRPGQDVLLKVTPEGVLLYTHEQAVKRLQDWCAAHIPPGVSLAEELLAERRAEAAKEAG